MILFRKRAGESHSELAYRTLRENIMQIQMEPGAIINEIQLAEEMKISRTPVHEAVGRLREERLIEVIPRRQSRVALLDVSYINEGFFMRCTMEPAVLRAAAGNLSASQVSELRQNLEHQKRILDGTAGEPLLNFFIYDDEFHKSIYLAANKKNIYDSVSRVISHMDWIRYLVTALGGYDEGHISFQNHQEIFNMLLFGVPAAFPLEQFIHDHMVGFRRYLPRLMEEYPHYFHM